MLEFVEEDWVRQVRPESLERVAESQASEALQLRHEDIVWKARWRAAPGWVYIPIEFQSTVDRWMGLRMANYSGLLSQGLVNARQLGRSRRMPPVFPLVWCNGRERWTAPLEASELCEKASGGLEEHVCVVAADAAQGFLAT